MPSDTRALASNWQTRLGVSGEVVWGADALDQFIRIVLTTQLGSVPHMLELGIDWFGIIDMPIDDALPLLTRGAAAAFRRWIEPRGTLVSIEPVSVNEKLTARLVYRAANSDALRTLEVAP